MNLELELSEDMESRLREEARANDVDVATFVTRAVQEKLASIAAEATESPTMSNDDWLREFVTWADGHPQVPHLDTSRESLYPDRGG